MSDELVRVGKNFPAEVIPAHVTAVVQSMPGYTTIHLGGGTRVRVDESIEYVRQKLGLRVRNE